MSNGGAPSFRFRLRNANGTGKTIVKVKGKTRKGGASVGTDLVKTPSLTQGNKADYSEWPQDVHTDEISVWIALDEEETDTMEVILPQHSVPPVTSLNAPDGIQVAVSRLYKQGGVLKLNLQISYVENNILKSMTGLVP